MIHIEVNHGTLSNSSTEPGFAVSGLPVATSPLAAHALEAVAPRPIVAAVPDIGSKRGGRACRPRVLVVGPSYEGALPIASLAEKHGCVGVPLPASEIRSVDQMAHLDVVLLLPQVSEEQQRAVCRFLRTHQLYHDIPVAAIAGLAGPARGIMANHIFRLPIEAEEVIASVCRHAAAPDEWPSPPPDGGAGGTASLPSGPWNPSLIRSLLARNAGCSRGAVA